MRYKVESFIVNREILRFETRSYDEATTAISRVLGDVVKSVELVGDRWMYYGNGRDHLAWIVEVTEIDENTTLGELAEFLRKHDASDLRVTTGTDTSWNPGYVARGGTADAFGVTAIDAIIALARKIDERSDR